MLNKSKCYLTAYLNYRSEIMYVNLMHDPCYIAKKIHFCKGRGYMKKIVEEGKRNQQR